MTLDEKLKSFLIHQIKKEASYAKKMELLRSIFELSQKQKPMPDSKESITIPKLFYDVIQGLPIAVQNEVIVAIIEYQFIGLHTDLVHPASKAIVELMKVIVDKKVL